MAKKKGIKTANVCGGCILGRWSRKHINMDLNGRPILKTCIYATFGRNQNGEPVTLRNTKACEHYREAKS